MTTLPSLAFALDKFASVFAKSRVGFVAVKSVPADLQQLGEWLGGGFEVPIDSVVPVRAVAGALTRLMNGEVAGRVAVQVLDGF